jgi:magnesium transporter
MHWDFIYAFTNDDQEDSARKIQKYDLIALPAVNDQNILAKLILGI